MNWRFINHVSFPYLNQMLSAEFWEGGKLLHWFGLLGIWALLDGLYFLLKFFKPFMVDEGFLLMMVGWIVQRLSILLSVSHRTVVFVQSLNIDRLLLLTGVSVGVNTGSLVYEQHLWRILDVDMIMPSCLICTLGRNSMILPLRDNRLWWVLEIIFANLILLWSFI